MKLLLSPSRFQITVVSILSSVLLFGIDTHASPPKEKKPETKTVPIPSMYATVSQMGIKVIPEDPKDPARKELAQLMEKLPNIGTSNIFLVHGKDIRWALNATRYILIHGRSGEIAGNPDDDSKHDEVWLVIYLGTYRRTLLIRSVEHSGNIIKATYAKPDSDALGPMTYFYWVPLGKLAKNEYQLELYQDNEKLPSLTRRVKVWKN